MFVYKNHDIFLYKVVDFCNCRVYMVKTKKFTL